MEDRIATRPQDYSSVVLREIVSRLRSGSRKTVLDLGPPSGDNLQFFAARGCKFFISDFFDSLLKEGHAARRDAAAFRRACAQLLPFPEDTRFDLILAWDLLDYLQLSEVEGLMQHLRRFSHEGTRMMALVSIYQQIPDQPCLFSLQDEYRVHFEACSRGLRESLRHKEPDLVGRMMGFEVENCMLLRQGIKEYCFILGAGAQQTTSSALA